jgi:hypothetical protein
MIALAKFILRSSTTSDPDIDSLIAVSIFCGLGLLLSLALLLLDQHMHFGWLWSEI